jgi:peptidoglycan/xylan/chitin deacetylase (PgdA/CDA1 family)
MHNLTALSRRTRGARCGRHSLMSLTSSPPRTAVRIIAIAALIAATIAMIPFHHSSAASRVTTFNTFDTSEPVIALTFDVTFDRGDGPMILDILASRGVVATFGITGIWAERNPDLIRRMVNDGHQLMNHTYDHPSFTGAYTGSTIHSPQPPQTRAQIVWQLQRTEQIVLQQTGVNMQPYFRPPYGDYDQNSLSAAADAGYTYNIMWTIDSLGWHGVHPDDVRQRVLNAARPGANILMHVGEGATDGAALARVIDELRARGYRFATVQQFVEGDLTPNAPRYFPETDQTIAGNFRLYWERFGGLAIFGYPLTPEYEVNGVTMQQFERARFELHPDSWPERYDVQLGRLGSEFTEHRQNQLAFRPIEAQSDQHCTYFPQTGHTLCHGFRGYWERFGGLAIFGFPISQEFREVNPDTGNVYVVQYFERQRFEWRPGEWPERYDVMLGRLGAHLLE